MFIILALVYYSVMKIFEVHTRGVLRTFRAARDRAIHRAIQKSSSYTCLVCGSYRTLVTRRVKTVLQTSQ